MHQKRVGVLRVKGLRRGSMVFSGENLAHKCFRIESSEVSNSFFTKFKKLNSIHLRIDIMTDPSYLLNMGETQNKHLFEILKESWGYLVERRIHLAAEYIPSLSNQTADWASRNFQGNSEWKLCLTVLKSICSHLGKPLLDLFASRLCHQLSRYIAWRPDPQNVATDAFQQDWKYQFLHAFLTFSMIGRVLRKV